VVLPAAILLHRRSGHFFGDSSGSFFLSSIWMSGYGIAAAPISGNLSFPTGNSRPGTYDGVFNIQESVVKVDPQLVNRLGIFAPSNEDFLDQLDGDLSSGGVLLLPPQPGPFPHLAATACKTGTMYLPNRASLGGFTPGGPRHRSRQKTIGQYWCGPSYFTGPDGVGRVVRNLFVGSKSASRCPGMPTRSKEPMIRPARCMRRPSREQRIRPRFGRWIADDQSASRAGTAGAFRPGRKAKARRPASGPSAAAAPRCSCQVSIDAMNKHLAEISRCVGAGAIALRILDGAAGPARRGSLGQTTLCSCRFHSPRTFRARAELIPSP
jgi:hypothetical protein